VEEEEVGSYWMSFRKREGTGNWNWKHQTAVFGELILEEDTDLL